MSGKVERFLDFDEDGAGIVIESSEYSSSLESNGAFQEDLFDNVSEVDTSKYLVYKRNELIHGRFKLSAFALKTVSAIASRIDPRCEDIPAFTFTVPELAGLLKVSNSMIYQSIDSLTSELKTQYARLKPRDHEYDRLVNEERMNAEREGRKPRRIPRRETGSKDEFDKVSWFKRVTYSKSKGIIEFEFDEDMKEYLINFTNDFTQYHYHQIQMMKSNYSIRLYEILRSYLALKYVRQGHTRAIRTISYIDLREILGVSEGTYKKFYDFERRVLSVAKKEMQGTDLDFNYIVPERKQKGSKAKVRTIMFEIIALSTENLVSDDWQENLKTWLPKNVIDTLFKKYDEDIIERNVKLVECQIGEGKDIKNIKSYLLWAVKYDIESSKGVLNPFNYNGTERVYVKNKLISLWPSLPEFVKEEFIEYRFEKGTVAGFFEAFKKETGKRSISEAISDIEDLSWG